jgi:hypothetical protein
MSFHSDTAASAAYIAYREILLKAEHERLIRDTRWHVSRRARRGSFFARLGSGRRVRRRGRMSGALAGEYVGAVVTKC